MGQRWMQCITHSVPYFSMPLGDNAPISIEPLVASPDESLASYALAPSHEF
jgi:hypothetical protein